MRKRRSCAIALRSDTAPKPRIVVAGAGAIGCFVGGLLAAAGRDVTLLVRPRVADRIRAHGLELTDLDGMKQTIAADALHLVQDPACLAQADVVLVTVKSRDTAGIGAEIARHTPQGAQVVSLQNGVTNAAALREVLPGYDVRAGMVPFNVVPMPGAGFHRATDGHIVIEAGLGALGTALHVPGLKVEENSDIENIQWGKFLLNLNNALNALSGLPLHAQLSDRAWRKLMADQWDEALRVISAAGATPVSTTPVSVKVIPWVLRLPTFMFTRAAAAMLRIDPTARASMSYDLMENRPTEIDVLQGEIVRMGQRLGLPTPINAGVAEALRRAEAAVDGVPAMTAGALRREIASG
jgi:2-dehydropantoate 2-reductase